MNDVSKILDVFFTKDLPGTPNSGFGENMPEYKFMQRRDIYAKIMYFSCVLVQLY